MKQCIAKKIYYRVCKSMTASYQNFAYYAIKKYDNTWLLQFNSQLSHIVGHNQSIIDIRRIDTTNINIY